MNIEGAPPLVQERQRCRRCGSHYLDFSSPGLCAACREWLPVMARIAAHAGTAGTVGGIQVKSSPTRS